MRLLPKRIVWLSPWPSVNEVTESIVTTWPIILRRYATLSFQDEPIGTKTAGTETAIQRDHIPIALIRNRGIMAIRDEGVVRDKAILPRPRGAARWRARRGRAVDRTDRRREVLDEGDQPSEDPRGRRHPDRRGRWPQGLPRGDWGDLFGNDGADLHRAVFARSSRAAAISPPTRPPQSSCGLRWRTSPPTGAGARANGKRR
jgi:hypothetical protein